MVETYNLRNVIFTGQVTSAEKVALFKGCRAFVLPSHLRSEAFGVVLIEAAMLGKPMITCEIGTGTSYVNQHSKTGYVVAPESPGELSEAINVLQKDDLLAHEMGAAARDRYDQYFSGNILGRAYANLYRELS
jgi:rhamnosyl/mannosyltransferase